MILPADLSGCRPHVVLPADIGHLASAAPPPAPHSAYWRHISQPGRDLGPLPPLPSHQTGHGPAAGGHVTSQGRASRGGGCSYVGDVPNSSVETARRAAPRLRQPNRPGLCASQSRTPAGICIHTIHTTQGRRSRPATETATQAYTDLPAAARTAPPSTEIEDRGQRTETETEDRDHWRIQTCVLGGGANSCRSQT